MEWISSVMGFLQSEAGVAVTVGLLALSEALASIPAIQANSVFQLVLGLLKKMAPVK